MKTGYVTLLGAAMALALSSCVATVEPSANPTPSTEDSTPSPALVLPSPSPLRPPPTPPAGAPAPD